MQRVMSKDYNQGDDEVHEHPWSRNQCTQRRQSEGSRDVLRSQPRTCLAPEHAARYPGHDGEASQRERSIDPVLRVTKVYCYPPGPIL